MPAKMFHAMVTNNILGSQKCPLFQDSYKVFCLALGHLLSHFSIEILFLLYFLSHLSDMGIRFYIKQYIIITCIANLIRGQMESFGPLCLAPGFPPGHIKSCLIALVHLVQYWQHWVAASLQDVRQGSLPLYLKMFGSNLGPSACKAGALPLSHVFSDLHIASLFHCVSICNKPFWNAFGCVLALLSALH